MEGCGLVPGGCLRTQTVQLRHQEGELARGKTADNSAATHVKEAMSTCHTSSLADFPTAWRIASAALQRRGVQAQIGSKIPAPLSCTGGLEAPAGGTRPDLALA